MISGLSGVLNSFHSLNVILVSEYLTTFTSHHQKPWNSMKMIRKHYGFMHLTLPVLRNYTHKIPLGCFTDDRSDA